MAKLLLEDLYKQLTLTDEQRKAIGTHFTDEVKKAIASRLELERKWERSYRLYEGLRPRKDFPWRGAANVNVPLVPIHASAIHARFMTSLFSPEPFWRVRAKNPDYQDFAQAATDYLDWSQQSEFPFYEAVRDFAWDSIKYGLGVLKVTWKRRKGKKLRYERAEQGSAAGAEPLTIAEDEVLIDDRPDVISIPPHLFVWPNGYDNIQTMPWICHMLRYSPEEVQALEDEGWLYDVAETVKAVQVIRDRIDMVQDEVIGFWPTVRNTCQLFEIWTKYKIPDSDRPPGELHIVVDSMTGKLLRCNPNPYFHRRRPFVLGRLEVREHTVAGIGITDMIGDMNDELNTIHNQTVDATTVATVQMYKVRAGSPAEAGLDQIWPGKRIPVSTPDDVQELAMGPLTTTSQPLETMVQQYAEKRTGISDFNLGREPTPARRGTATGTMAIIQEGNKKFDYQIRDMRMALGEVGSMLLALIQQMNPDGVVRQVLGRDADKFKAIKLIFPDVPLDTAVSVEVVAGTATINRQVQRQDSITLFQLLMSFYQQSFQLGQLLAQPGIPPQLAMLGMQLAKGGETMMKEILLSFENRRGDELIPTLEDIYAQLYAGGAAQAAAQQAGMAGAPSGAGGPGGPGPGAGAGGPAGPAGGGFPGGGPLPQGPPGGLGAPPSPLG